MSEYSMPPEQPYRGTELLELSRGLGTPFNEESEELLLRFKPRMPDEEKSATFGAFHDSLQRADTEIADTDIPAQLRRQIGIVIATAHAHYTSESTWPQMSEELWSAFDMADQNAEFYPEFSDLKEQIYNLLKGLAQRQYRP